MLVFEHGSLYLAFVTIKKHNYILRKLRGSKQNERTAVTGTEVMTVLCSCVL